MKIASESWQLSTPSSTFIHTLQTLTYYIIYIVYINTKALTFVYVYVYVYQPSEPTCVPN